ncbi:uncharacterized protein LOC111367260 [Olea europaea var. sylvestris]|uniref:DUF4228 domain-containing protein n=1 Tax=Olea europaea subsp. europaea TaxID=158383 RepID=A0A8S0QWB8_OLEEU|nr:uncharacterized protein LOC111367260 [Olea europaea var. sylvestris]CAA2970604.1 Hypothetical predicted protein [Olea europaea subsp. europaea]
MGNCQAAEAATVLILHPNNKVERIYKSVCANEVMASNPGHYVALIITSPAAKTGNGTPVKQLKLLRPDDTLLIGQVYRLVSFEDVLKEFAEKKCKKLGKLLKERGALNLEPKKKSKSKPANCSSHKTQQDVQHLSSSGRGRGTGRHHVGGGQWRPALQSIAEIGT